MRVGREAIKPGDCILIVNNDGIFRKLVGWFTRSRGEEPTKAKHVAAVTDRRTVIEALWTVKEKSRTDWFRDNQKYEVWQNKNWSDKDRENICKEMYDYKGHFYGFWKLFLHAADLLLSKVTPKEVFLFRRAQFIDDYPICNWLYAYSVFNAVGEELGNVPKLTDPDSIRDYFEKSEDWFVVHSKG